MTPSLTTKAWRLSATTPASALEQPLHWRKPQRVGIKGDLFHEDVPDEFIDRVFAVMALTPQHTYQVPTECAQRMREYVTDPNRAETVEGWWLDLGGRVSWGWPLPNVWLGVSVENQRWADERIPELLATPAGISTRPVRDTHDPEECWPARIPA